MRTRAEDLFKQEKFEEALPLYSQLLALKLESSEYNYRFGACQLFTSQNKEEGIKYLNFASKDPTAPSLAHFYYGLGLQLNYQFEKAVVKYEKYKTAASKKDKEADLVDLYITQCKNGKTLVSNFTDISVIQRKVLPRTDFYRNYDLSDVGGKIIVKPEDFMSEEDKKRDAKFLMYFQEDAEYIYYASYSDKNATGKDLFAIQKLPTGGWSQPTKLSAVINTPYDEDFPFIHPDGNVLYFASKGHNGMGGYDIFKSTRRGDGTWTKPINMEFAINTPWDDFLFISDKEESTAWFASNRETSSKQVSIYRIGIERVPLDLTLIKGTFEAEGSKKAKITVEDMVQNKVVGVYESERQFGGYLLDLRGSGKYKFIVEAEESGAVYTGLVEIPREKGLKQFRQEMKLVATDGKEQLQIINHFDEQLQDDEPLLTAEILMKQANLSVNASEEDVVRTTEILDSNKPLANNAGAGLSKDAKLADAENQVKELKGDAKLLNQKAALLYQTAESNSTSSEPNVLAEAAISAELAGIYKTEADKREAVATRMNNTLGTLQNVDLQEAAFNAQYNQLAATGSNFESLDDFESEIPKDFEKRSLPAYENYETKSAELEQLQSDLKGIDEEITYYETEIGNTKDEAMKEEFALQKTDAAKARPEKIAAIDRAKTDFATAEKQKSNASNYFEITETLIETAAEKASTITSTVSASAVNQLQTTLEARAAADPILLAFVAPKSIAEKASPEENTKVAAVETLKEEREALNSPSSKNDDESNPSAVNNGTQNSQESSEKEFAETTLDVPQNETNEPEYTDPTDNQEIANDEPIPTSNVQNSDQVNKANALNEEIRLIEAQPSQVEIVNGDYATKFQNNINEAANAEDPIIAETRKAEIYDQWVENIEYRIDSLQSLQSEENSEEKKAEIASEISILEPAKKEKESLAMDSYESIALMSDQQAISASQTNLSVAANTPSQPTSTQNNPTTSTSPTESQPTSESPSPASLSSGPKPITADLLAAENKPPTVTEVNAEFSQKLTQVTTTADPIEKLEYLAKVNKEWAEALQAELVILGAQIDEASSDEERRKLEELAGNVNAQKTEKQSASAAQYKKIEKIETERKYANQQVALQNQLYEYVENYNVSAFEQISDQIDSIPEEVARLVQEKTLNQNWMIAIQNEQLKTNSRLKNTDDPNQIAGLEEKMVELQAKKSEVLSRLEAIGDENLSVGPGAPSSVLIKGSERYEGYIPVETNKPDEFETLSQKSIDASSTKETEINVINSELATTKKKKEKAAMQDAIHQKQRELDILRLESKVYAEAAEKLSSTQSLLLTMEVDDLSPAAMQIATAQQLEKEASQLTAIATSKREIANNTKKKKVIPVVEGEAKQAEHLALMKRKEADFASKLASDIKSIENLAIEQNFIIPTGEAVALPIVNRSLNPNEKRDVGQTEQFLAYNAIKSEADSIRKMASELDFQSNQLQSDAAQKMTQSVGNNDQNGEVITQVNYANEAFVMYAKADSLNRVKARLNRKAAMIENQANAQLLTNPEEVYNNILAYYNTPNEPLGAVAEATAKPSDSLPIQSPTNDRVNFNDIPIVTNETEATSADSQKFDLLPPTEEKTQQRIEVKRDVVTNTIFQVDKSARISNYSVSNPIPVDPPLPSGIIYKVQIGAFRNAIKQDAFKGIKPIVGESTGKGFTRYLAGEFEDFASADFAKDEIREIGYPDAFVVAYLNGNRISVAEARAYKGGGAIIASSTNQASSVPNTMPTTTAPKTGPQGPSVVKQGALIVQDVQNQRGTFYTVQVGVFSKPVSSREIYNITPLNQENMANGLFRYSSGVYDNEAIATQARDEIRALGIADAFVVVYKGGKRITVEQAQGELGTAQPSTPNPTSQVVDVPQDIGRVESAASYRILLGTFSGGIPVKQAGVILGLGGEGIDKVSNAGGSSTYYYGNFTSREQAESEAAKLISQGLTGASVVAK
jgi:hypothetical protein